MMPLRVAVSGPLRLYIDKYRVKAAGQTTFHDHVDMSLWRTLNAPVVCTDGSLVIFQIGLVL